VRAARRLGYTRIKLQTNAMLLSYAEYARRVVDAGVTDVAFAIKGASAAIHDHYTRTPGSHALLLDAIERFRETGLTLEGDVLVYRGNVHELPTIVRDYHARGLGHFRVWLLSAVDDASADVVAEVPRISDVVPKLREAVEQRLSADPNFIVSLHTPPCTLPPELHQCRFFAPELDLLVANPGGHAFRLEESPIEGGHYLEGCERCPERRRCSGVRRDYVAVHGSEEFGPDRLSSELAQPASSRANNSARLVGSTNRSGKSSMARSPR
jgi:cyclic pyranopterin phosphate synthase